MNYKTLLAGVGGIEEFLGAESISAQEAFNASHFSLDILAAYKIEGLVPPKDILSCLIDLNEVFPNNKSSAFAKIIIKNYPQRPPSRHIELSKYIFTDELFKYFVIFSEEANISSAEKLFKELIISLSSRDLFKSIFLIHSAAKLYLNKDQAFALKQSINHMHIIALSMNDDKLQWWLKMANLTVHWERM